MTVYDKNKRLLDGASGNNQFRLHLGFHYARHHGTRLQSRDGFQRFLERYPSLSERVANNVYAVPKQASLMDFSTYKLIMAASGIDFIEMPNPPALIANVEGCLLTRERVIMLQRAREFFMERLQDHLELDTQIDSVRDLENCVEINGRRFDYLIDATWGHLIRPNIEVIYEPTLLLYYECTREAPALTFVDGPLCSVYPTEDPTIYTLSSVVHTPLGRYETPLQAYAQRDSVSKDLVDAKRLAMESQVSKNVPAFRDLFRFVGVQLAIKTKPIGQYDDRSCYVFQDGRVFTVMSGKIDTIFFATERILSMMGAQISGLAFPGLRSSLRDSIIMPMS